MAVNNRPPPIYANDPPLNKLYSINHIFAQFLGALEDIRVLRERIDLISGVLWQILGIQIGWIVIVMSVTVLRLCYNLRLRRQKEKDAKNFGQYRANLQSHKHRSGGRKMQRIDAQNSVENYSSGAVNQNENSRKSSKIPTKAGLATTSTPSHNKGNDHFADCNESPPTMGSPIDSVITVTGTTGHNGGVPQSHSRPSLYNSPHAAGFASSFDNSTEESSHMPFRPRLHSRKHTSQSISAKQSLVMRKPMMPRTRMFDRQQAVMAPSGDD